ncbi:hypothetical protein [Mycoplasma sp. P36-A1]|uniref:hypothetical protein n=1 Tax=Mycoplasma sp. P36-A1 TaxID=3252900 RepID=UPI003C2DDF1B
MDYYEKMCAYKKIVNRLFKSILGLIVILILSTIANTIVGVDTSRMILISIMMIIGLIITTSVVEYKIYKLYKH